MHWSVQCAYPWVLYVGIPVLMVWAYVVIKQFSKHLYYYPLADVVRSHFGSSAWIHKFIFSLQFLSLLMMLIALSRPQFVDVTSNVDIEGIDIMMVLDVSGSMNLFDDPNDRRTRIDVAKQEAINFIDKRTDDQIGLVLFAQDAVMRCPLTYDKTLLRSLIQDIQLGVIRHEGTVLSRAIVMAAQRLKKSKARSKIMILLTDGEPTPGMDIHPQDAVNIVQKLGIKVYTIGIGGEQGGYLEIPMFGIRPMGSSLNVKLLQAIAKATDGQSFEARNPDDLKKIYETINQLEKTEYEAQVYTHYEDIFSLFVIISFIIIALLIIIRTFIWFIV